MNNVMDIGHRFREMVRAVLVAAVGNGVVAGCANTGPQIRSALKSSPIAPSAETSAAYTLACPDAIDVIFANRPRLSGRYAIEADGAVAIAEIGRVVVAGATADEAEIRLAEAANEPRPTVRATVAEHNSRLIFLVGPGADEERAVAYRGAEPVVEFLRRTGGLVAQAQPNEVHVIRPHVAAGRRPEVFDVDLEAILIQNDPQTNVLLQPYDQVYVGATRRSTLARYLPGGGPPAAAPR